MILSIIIINFNGKRFFEGCLQSIAEHVPFEHEVIVVDNASTDGSAEYLRSTFPEVRLIESECNLGFTGGNNLAAYYATGRYLLLLNNDTVIRSSVVSLVNMMDADERIGALGCRLYYEDGRQQESVGYMPSPTSIVLSWTPFSKIFPTSYKCRRTVRADSPLYEESYREVEWVSGAFLLTQASLWQRLGGLDERYFMYMEDTDYCRRIRNVSYKVVYSSNCEVVHFEGAGRSWVGERALLNTTNSYVIYVGKFFGKISALLLRFFLAPVFVARSLFFSPAILFGGDQVKIEKAVAYWRAAKMLFFCGAKLADRVPKSRIDTFDA